MAEQNIYLSKPPSPLNQLKTWFKDVTWASNVSFLCPTRWGQLVPQPTPQQTTPSTTCPRRKRQRGSNEPLSGSDAPSIEQSLTPTSNAAVTLPAKDTPSEIRPAYQPVIVGSNMASTSAPPSLRWQCTFMVGDKSFLNDSFIRTWRSDLGG